MIGTASRIVPAQWLLWPAVAGSLLLVAAGTGLIAPLVPLMAVAGLALVLAAPTRWSAAGLLLIALVVDNPGERPNEARWSSPLLSLGELLYENLRKHTGIEALRFCALEFLIALLVGVALWRKGQGDRLDDPDRLGDMPNPMKLGFASFFGAIVFLEVYGLARGGDFKNSLWQVRQLFWLPILGVLFGNAFKREDSRANVLRVLMAAAFVRSLSGIFYYFAVCRPPACLFFYTRAGRPPRPPHGPTTPPRTPTRC